MDIVSYLLGKKAGGGSSGSYGWTTKNANVTEAVFKSLPEEVIVSIDGNQVQAYDVRLLKMPDLNQDGFVEYVGQFSGRYYDNPLSYVASGTLHITFLEDGTWDDTMFKCLHSKIIDGDLFMSDPVIFEPFESIEIKAYKGKPIELPTYTVTINDTSYSAVWEEEIVSYSIDGGNTFIPIKSAQTTIPNVSMIEFRSSQDYGGTLTVNGGEPIWGVTTYEECKLILTEDTTFELYVSW